MLDFRKHPDYYRRRGMPSRKLFEVYAADFKPGVFRTLDEAFDYAASKGYGRAEFYSLHDDGILAYRSIGREPYPGGYVYFKEY